MAESKFLKFQDRNRDLLIDICEVDLGPPEQQVCKDCVPNPKALVPNWKTSEPLTPFLNEKLCLYQIAITTPETTTGGDSTTTEAEAEANLQAFFENYAGETYEAFLDFYDKAITEKNKIILSENVEFRDYYLEALPNSHLQLLYSFPFDIISKLEDEETEEDEEDEELEDIVVEYVATEMATDMIRIRKSLNLYSRYEKVYRFTDGGTLVFLETGGLFKLENYGDAGLFPGSSITSNLLPQLDQFLNNKGFNIAGVGGLSGLFEDKVTKIEFTFTGDYRLKKMKVYSESCGQKPRVFNKRKLKQLNRKSAWKNRTAVAYFAQMKKMERDLTARVPKPWLEFIKEYTYPAIDSTINAGYANTDPEKTAASCIASNLAAEGKQLGQDILDDVFGIGDAIAAQFHKMLCNEDYKELLEQKVKFGQIPKGAIDVAAQGRDVDQIDAARFVPSGKDEDATQNIGAFALEQAFKELDENDQIFANFCALILNGFSGSGDIANQLDLLWANGLDKIRVCGLFDLMLDAIQCLFKGLTLEEALASMLKSALTAMSLENFGDLFVGLPPDKQQELDALVQKKLSEGDIFPPGSQAQRVSDAAASGENGRVDVDEDVELFPKPSIKNLKKPWENPDLISKQNEEMLREGSYESMSPTGIPPASGRKSDVGDATVKAQLQNTGSELNPALIMDAYIAALIEVYSENLLDLLDILNKFPGAQIIAKVIALIDCPIPPIFDPSLMDFLKDIELPFCRNTTHIGLPRLENFAGWIPKLKDIFRLLFMIIKIELQKLVIRIIIKLIVKLCELIGNAICKALETVGDIAAALPSIATGRTTFKDVIRESICGPDAPDEQIDDTIVDMFQKMGSGGAAFADREAVMAFAEDMSAATTRKEISDAVTGNPSETFLSVIEGLVQFEYPQFADAFDNRENISGFFNNIGNLMPADARQMIKDFARGLDEDDQLPANPTLCATPQQIEDFCSVRSGLLEGRATPEQIARLCDSARNTFKDDLEDLSTILNDGIPAYFENNLPPIISDPGCNNGLAPFEPEEIAKATTNSLDGNMEALKIAYTYDMIGNGPGERNWGFMNMVLSDTMGKPYTAHVRKEFNSGGIFSDKKYVNFYVNSDGTGDDADATYAKNKRQRGAFPNNVADWLMTEMPKQFLAASFDSSNNPKDNKVSKKSFEDLGFGGLFGNVNIIALPDRGYNVDVSVDFDDTAPGGGRVKFNKKARKKDADLELKFRDNAKGTAEGDSPYSYGFNLKLFLSDIVKEDGEFKNRQDDNARIIITNVVNTSAKVDAADGAYQNDPDAEKKEKNTDATVLRWRAYEFLSTDNGLDGLDLLSYRRFSETGDKTKNYIPQVYMLQDIIEKAGDAPPSARDIKNLHDAIMNRLFENFSEQVYTNKDAFKYGAEFDDLTYEDVEYGVVNDSGVFVEYAEYAENNEITNEDAVLGISRMQYKEENENGPKNRVFYLDPAKHGGSYFNPPVYIKPTENTGWLGFVNVMFPEIGPCKPYRADVIDFGSIQERINNTYSRIPEDERLKTDPNCINEEPYNRILERPAKAGIEGLISAAIRIYASVHLLKASATFTKFKPDFKNTFSSLYAQYIVEKMEEDFKDAQPNGFFEFFNPFKDEEFWYAFLEQAVQTYARRYADGQLPDPSGPIVDALSRIEKVIDKHRRIDRKETYTTKDGRTILSLRDAKKANDAGPLQTLKGYRADKNLEVIKETEDDAKLIFQEMVIEELQFMADVYIKNMQDVGLANEDNMVGDIRKYILEELTAGSTLDIDKEIKEEVENVPTEDLDAASDLYAPPGVFITEDGEEYSGYYHIHIDEEGDPIYMEGSYHTEDDHPVLRVSADKIIVPIGDVSWDDSSTSDSKPFKIRKYIRVGDDIVYSNDDAREALNTAATNAGREPSETNISDLFPGTMELVLGDNDAPIGITGELGVRYGIEFFVGSNRVTSVEVDALDLPIDQFQQLEPDTKLLLCLVNNLLDDPDFNAVVKYVFPLNKILSTIAIYNDMAFVPSIGELVVEDSFKEEAYGVKPGRKLSVTPQKDEEDNIIGFNLQAADGQDGWFTVDERSPGIGGNGLFMLHYDKWDQTIFTKSKFRIKKLFKGFYNSRDFDPNGDDSDGAGQALIAQLSAAFKPASGQRLLPWWKKRMLRSNPFNADGALCDKKD
jgi:hypothetical protein